MLGKYGFSHYMPGCVKPEHACVHLLSEETTNRAALKCVGAPGLERKETQYQLSSRRVRIPSALMHLDFRQIA